MEEITENFGYVIIKGSQFLTRNESNIESENWTYDINGAFVMPKKEHLEKCLSTYADSKIYKVTVTYKFSEC